MLDISFSTYVPYLQVGVIVHMFLGKFTQRRLTRNSIMFLYFESNESSDMYSRFPWCRERFVLVSTPRVLRRFFHNTLRTSQFKDRS